MVRNNEKKEDGNDFWEQVALDYLHRTRALFSKRTKGGLKTVPKPSNRGVRKKSLGANVAEQVKLLIKDRSIRSIDLARTYGVSRTKIYKLAEEAA